jgi:ferredoxin-NADP reductase
MKLHFVKKEQEATDVYSFYFKPEQELTWTAGQFLHYTLPHANPDDRGLKRWFTISTAPFEKLVRITTRINPDRSSSFKSTLMQMKEGDEIEAEQPEGDFVFENPDACHVFVAGGIGITPYRSMLAQLNHDNKEAKIDLLYASRSEDLLFGDELKKLEQKYSTFHVHPFTGDNKITLATLEPYIKKDDAIIYISGPEPMVEDFDKQLKAAGMPEGRVKGDYFPNYPEY